MDYQKNIAKAGLEIKAIKLNSENPFTWASGYRMPIYNDNRLFLSNPDYRKMIVAALEEKIYDIAKSMRSGDKIPFDIIAGTSTAGIPHATSLADKLNLPMIYVRDKPKDHGLKNQIEGIDAESNLSGKKVILIEDLISTGGSSARAVKAIRDADGKCDYCVSIFSYGLQKAGDVFNEIAPGCDIDSLLTYPVLLEVAKEVGYIDLEQEKLLGEWRQDPFNWGNNHGFLKVEK
jgi:orotate phosphoribosyltransferase